MKFTISGLDTNKNFETVGHARTLNEARSIACQYRNKGYTDLCIENIKTGFVRRFNPMTVDTYTPVIMIDCEPTTQEEVAEEPPQMTLSEALTASPIGEAVQVVGIRKITAERYFDLTVTIDFPGGEGKPQKWHRITQGSAEWNFKHMIPHYKPAGWEPKQEVNQIETFVSWSF